MVTLLIGIAILFGGAIGYGLLCEKVMKPTDMKTPAIEKTDGVDFIPIKKWKNSLIELLNIAGTGPILGPIQGVLFGPIAFITIPIGCVIGGAFHDYMCGMISVRNGGAQMPMLVKNYLGKYANVVFNIFIGISLLLVGVVFTYTPGDLVVSHILKQDSTLSNPVMWIVYAVIFAYYIIATLLPIDKVIGKVYPFFGAVLLLSAIGVFIGLFVKGYRIDELWSVGFSFKNQYGDDFIPIFFVTVACGIVSGFHSTQTTLVSRTIKSEKDGKTVFYNMMILEGLIAMIWAAAAMGAMNAGLVTSDTMHNKPTDVVGAVATDMFGKVGGIIAVIGVIILPITTGDTALRSLRIMVSEAFHIDTTRKRNLFLVTIPIFAIVAGFLVWAKSNENGFNIMWRYFSWLNEIIAVFAFAIIILYMRKNKMPYIMAIIPGMFYMFMVTCYIVGAKIGFNLPPLVCYIVAGIAAITYAVALSLYGRKKAKEPVEPKL